MRRKVGAIFIVIGAVLLLAALSLFCYNHWVSEQAWSRSNSVLTVMDSQIEQNANSIQSYEELTTPHGPEMDEIEIEGWMYIGTLEIPSLGIELPIMSEWNYDGMQIAPGRYTGSVWTNDIVICGHNYTRHFGGLKNLDAGDTVIFTDVNGNVFNYEVVEVTILQPTAVEEMISGGWDMTLFTCTYGGQTRLTVRCDRVEKE